MAVCDCEGCEAKAGKEDAAGCSGKRAALALSCGWWASRSSCGRNE